MKKHFLLFFLPAILILGGCDPEPVDCLATTSEFSDLFDATLQNNHVDMVTMDTEIHEYTFVLANDKEVCKIGYQSHPDLSTTPYEIEIVDGSNNQIYSASHTFSSTQTSYVDPVSTIDLQAGVSYTIRRIQTNWGQYIDRTIGRMSTGNNMSFPYTEGDLTITGSNFYTGGNANANFGIPFIDLIFK